jgi:hypothetical protein
MDSPFIEWIARTPLNAALRSSRVAVPVIETIHLLAVALAVGTIMVIDMSVLGVALRRDAVPRIAREMDPWIWSGLGCALITGVVLFCAEAAKVSCKPVFWVKLAFLAGTFVFHLTAHRKLLLRAHPLEGARARWIAGISLALWFSVAFGGKAIGLFG